MAISNTQSSVTYVGNGAVAVYGAPFPVLRPEHLSVHGVTDANVPFAYQLGVHYSVTINNDAGGGPVSATVNLFTVLSYNWTMTIDRIVPIVQESIFDNQAGMSPKIVEKQLDYLVMICQQLWMLGNSGLFPPAGWSADQFINYLLASIDNLWVHVHSKASQDALNQLALIVSGKADAAEMNDLRIAVSQRVDWTTFNSAKSSLEAADAALRDDLNAKADRTELTQAAQNLSNQIALLSQSVDGRFADAAASLQQAVADLQAQMDGFMPVAPEDGKSYVAVGRSWVPWTLTLGGPWDRDSSGITHLVERAVYKESAIWSIEDEVVSLKPTAQAGDEDDYWIIDAAGFAVLKN